MKTRILFFMATGSPVGGVATWLDRASIELSDRGYDPVVALVHGMKLHNPDQFRQYHPDLNHEIVDGRGMDREGRILACMRAIKRFKPKVVLPLGVLDSNDAAMRAKARGENLRVIGRAQGNLPPMLADLQDYRDGLDHVVCVGNMTRRYLVQHAGFSPDRVDHIPNGAANATTPHMNRSPDEPLRLGYIGRLMKDDKRVLDIPPFCHALAERGIKFHLTIAGSGPCEAELRDQLRPLGNQVNLIGAVKSADIYSHVLPRLDILLLFSASETFGIVLAEAMMNGVVPVTARYIGFESERLVINGVHGYSFPVGDFSMAADAVARLNDNPALLAEFAKQSRTHASTTYTWKHCFDRWDTVIQRAMDRKAVQAPMELTNPGPQNSGLLNRLGIPPLTTDYLRRIRRKMLGTPIPAGGEEWPLYRRNHSVEHLAYIHECCRKLESCEADRIELPSALPK